MNRRGFFGSLAGAALAAVAGGLTPRPAPGCGGRTRRRARAAGDLVRSCGPQPLVVYPGGASGTPCQAVMSAVSFTQTCPAASPPAAGGGRGLFRGRRCGR
jgi:hypothetical protein